MTPYEQEEREMFMEVMKCDGRDCVKTLINADKIVSVSEYPYSDALCTIEFVGMCMTIKGSYESMKEALCNR